MADAPSFFALSQDDQREILVAMESQLGVRASILEKDVWLCLVLEKLFQLQDAKPMAFKGGTSLSKIYRAIERFSEDIDVTIDWTALHPDPPQDGVIDSLSNRLFDKLVEEIKRGLETYIEQSVLPGLEAALQGEAPGVSVEYEIDSEGKKAKDKLRVFYPAVTERVEYVPQSVLIEFGAKNAIEPVEDHVIIPDIAVHVPRVSFSSAQVQVLSPQRTFWEKATLVHDECCRPAEKARKSLDRLSRHWYDLARLAHHAIGPAAIEDFALLGQVIQIKKRFYSYGFSQYDLCRTGGMKLIPDGATLSALRMDYEKMVEANMFYGDRLDFDEIVSRLTLLQAEINQQATAVVPEVASSARQHERS